ncbi:MAG TPA: ATP-binding protein [Tissierellales bacterium]|nr:ATP-binding protein [Tissierellales bacterium]
MPLKRKMTTIFIILVSIGILITGIVTYHMQKINSIKLVEEKILEEGYLIKDLIEKGNIDNNNLEDFLERYSKILNSEISFIDEQEIIIGSFSSGVNNEKLNFRANNKNPEKKRLIFKEISIENGGNISKIRIAASPEYLKKLNKKIILNTLIAVVAGFIVSLILGIQYVEQVTNPYKELIKATKNISEGKYGGEVYLSGDEEFEILTENFNTMSVKLRDTIIMLKESNTKLKATLTSIEDGVIAIDNNLSVILINPLAEKILEVKKDSIMDKKITKAFENKELNNVFIELINKSTFLNDAEVEVFEPNYRNIKITGSPIIQSDDPTRKLGLVFIIRDVTTLRKLEKVREDFVANVSHELKTPLTSIKGFVETLQEGAIENVESSNKFLDIIDFEVNRLNSLVSDLLLLSEVESQEENIIKEIIAVEKIIDDVIMHLGNKANKKEITLEKNIQEKLPNFYGNYNYFRQMLLNLIDNSIKYTPEYGTVKISAATENGNLIINIADNGIGIEGEEQRRIFERFYRVDKSRSNEVDGTGLGLAIVKHIVSTFNGKISIESEIGKGSNFIIILPVKDDLIY